MAEKSLAELQAELKATREEIAAKQQSSIPKTEAQKQAQIYRELAARGGEFASYYQQQAARFEAQAGRPTETQLKGWEYQKAKPQQLTTKEYTEYLKTLSPEALERIKRGDIGVVAKKYPVPARPSSISPREWKKMDIKEKIGAAKRGEQLKSQIPKRGEAALVRKARERPQLEIYAPTRATTPFQHALEFGKGAVSVIPTAVYSAGKLFEVAAKRGPVVAARRVGAEVVKMPETIIRYPSYSVGAIAGGLAIGKVVPIRLAPKKPSYTLEIGKFRTVGESGGFILGEARAVGKIDIGKASYRVRTYSRYKAPTKETIFDMRPAISVSESMVSRQLKATAKAGGRPAFGKPKGFAGFSISKMIGEAETGKIATQKRVSIGILKGRGAKTEFAGKSVVELRKAEPELVRVRGITATKGRGAKPSPFYGVFSKEPRPEIISFPKEVRAPAPTRVARPKGVSLKDIMKSNLGTEMEAIGRVLARPSKARQMVRPLSLSAVGTGIARAQRPLGLAGGRTGTGLRGMSGLRGTSGLKDFGLKAGQMPGLGVGTLGKTLIGLGATQRRGIGQLQKRGTSFIHFEAPTIKPPKPMTGAPFIPRQDIFKLGKRGRKRVSFGLDTRYTPSLGGIVLGLKAKKPPSTLAGVRLRPEIVFEKRRKK